MNNRRTPEEEAAYQAYRTVRIYRYQYQGKTLFDVCCGNYHQADESLQVATWNLAVWLCTEGEDLRDLNFDPMIIEDGPCEPCKGTGVAGHTPCPFCNGTGDRQ